MQNDAWRNEVSQLLEHCADSIRTKSDRQALAALGMVFAYLQRAEENGSRFAASLLEAVENVSGGGATQRFSYAPGELEDLVSQRGSAK